MGGISFFLLGSQGRKMCFFVLSATNKKNGMLKQCTAVGHVFNCFVLNFAANEILMWANSHEYH